MTQQLYRWRPLVVLGLIVACVVTLACGHFGAPPQLSPIGKTAYHADQVIKALAAVQQVTAAAEASHVIRATEARAIMRGLLIASQAGTDLARALQAGSVPHARLQKFVAMMRVALEDISRQLTGPTKREIQPYLDLVNTALTLLER